MRSDQSSIQYPWFRVASSIWSRCYHRFYIYANLDASRWIPCRIEQERNFCFRFSCRLDEISANGFGPEKSSSWSSNRLRNRIKRTTCKQYLPGSNDSLDKSSETARIQYKYHFPPDTGNSFGLRVSLPPWNPSSRRTRLAIGKTTTRLIHLTS